MLEPIKLKENYKRFIENYHKEEGSEEINLCCEVSTQDNECIEVMLKEYKGKTISEYMIIQNFEKGYYNDGKLPVMMKLVNSLLPSPIQVHFNDEDLLNHRQHNYLKIWVVLDCESGAFLYYGLDKTINKEELENKVKKNTLTEALKKIEVHKGDVISIDSGMLHGIGGRIVLCEIQPTNCSTYCLCNDYDANEIKNLFDIDQVFDLICLDTKLCSTEAECILINTNVLSIKLLKSCKIFQLYEYKIKNQVEFHINKENCYYLLFTEGNGILQYNENTSISVVQGEMVFIPAQNYLIKIEGECSFLLICL